MQQCSKSVYKGYKSWKKPAAADVERHHPYCSRSWVVGRESEKHGLTFFFVECHLCVSALSKKRAIFPEKGGLAWRISNPRKKERLHGTSSSSPGWEEEEDQDKEKLKKESVAHQESAFVLLIRSTSVVLEKQRGWKRSGKYVLRRVLFASWRSWGPSRLQSNLFDPNNSEVPIICGFLEEW